MIPRVLAVVATIALLAACSGKKADTPPAPTGPAGPAPAVTPPPPPPASAPASQPGAPKVIEKHGLRLEYQAGGVIVFKGKDQWGGTLDSTYENAGFLRNALPVLARSLTPEQTEFLRTTLGAPQPSDKKAVPVLKAPPPGKSPPPGKAPPPAKAPAAKAPVAP